MSEIFHEVEEEVRRERWMSLWRSYGGLLIAALVLLVGSVAGYEVWTHMAAQSRQEQTDTLMTAVRPLELENYGEAVSSLSAMRDELSGDMKALVMFREAHARIGNDDETGAIATLDAIAANGNVSQNLRDLATIHSAYLQVDTASFDEINSRVAPLAAEGSAWRSSALEVIGFSAYRNSRMDVAREQFQMLSSNPGTPAALRQRAQVTLDAIGGGSASSSGSEGGE